MTIQAIQTRYAGCHFRSRLEARWAVLFDHLGIEWEYEPQGVMVSHRLTREEGSFSYLPDFWLPGEGLWAEVKGSLTDTECLRLLNAAASLSSNDGGGCHDAGGYDVLVLGPVPRPQAHGLFGGRLPLRLHMHKGDLEAYGWPTQTPHQLDYNTVARDVGGPRVTEECGFTLEEAAKFLLKGLYTGDPIPASFVQGAVAARSARFEHGACG